MAAQMLASPALLRVMEFSDRSDDQAQPARESRHAGDTAPAALTVFLDCSNCDPTYLRQRIDWIDWVRDAEVGQVHLLITTRASATSVEYRLEFLGRLAFLGQDQLLTFSRSVTDTADERRRELARVIALGLARYAVQSGGGSQLEVTATSLAPVGVARPEDDPWNFWVISVGLNGFVNREARTDALQLSASLSANRTTEDWKVSFRATTSRSENTFEFDDGESFANVTRSSEGGLQLIRSLGDHWGAGGGASMQQATFTNLDPSLRAAGALEYNLFPYAESSGRLLTFTYFTGVTRFNYEEETIFGATTETLANHGAQVTLDLTRPWGSGSLDLQARQLLGRPDEYRVSLEGAVSYRILRGLSANLFASYAIVRDQRFLPRRGASDEEVLLRRRALRTDSSTSVNFGLSYTFGSIYNRTINSRLTGAGGRFERVF